MMDRSPVGDSREEGGDGTPEVCSFYGGAPATGRSMEQEPPVPEDGCRIRADGAVLHPQAEALFTACPWLRRVPVVGVAMEGYGPKLITALCFTYFSCKGVAAEIIDLSLQPMFMKRYVVDAKRFQRLAAICGTGWSMKAFVAAFTDTFALMGYTKRWYMLISCILGGSFSLGYALLPAQPLSADVAAAFIFLSTFGKSSVDILSEGHYSRLMRRNPLPGPELVGCVWLCILLGTLVASVIQGPLSDCGKAQVGVSISSALQFATGIFFVLNWYGEKTNRMERLQDLLDTKAALAKARAEARLGSPYSDREAVAAEKDLHPEGQNPSTPVQTSETNTRQIQQGIVAVDDELVGLPSCDAGEDARERRGVPTFSYNGVVVGGGDNDEVVAEGMHIPQCLFGVFEVNIQVVRQNWRVLLYSVVMTCSVLSMVCVTILGTTWDLMYVSIVISLACCACAFFALPLVIAKAQVFVYLNSLLYLQLPGALDSFYLADASCLPDGPHFSYVFYNTVSAVISNIGGLLGVYFFMSIFLRMNFQMTMSINVILIVVASFFDIIIVERWNVHIGIPDHAMYLCGDSIIYRICSMFTTMPCIILMSRLCPRGSESMIYALMSGFSNFGQAMSTVLGSLLIETRWPVNTQSVPCDFSNVRWLVITGHLCCPLLIIPLSFLLLPRARICDEIDINGQLIKAQVKSECTKERQRQQHISTREEHCGTNANAPDALPGARSSLGP
ncbi:hypothetical protein JIQ42_07871 [Leishmania sp. Namibia]|uniref:hypothetical protein n=1 Tax=Leishmania sp. Namibia TaxID=2802991 RepID=UPI001B6CD380|nr:hypothetical protein JIQ42_07871 [Leishmania sp. Namibia]